MSDRLPLNGINSARASPPFYWIFLILHPLTVQREKREVKMEKEFLPISNTVIFFPARKILSTVPWVLVYR